MSAASEVRTEYADIVRAAEERAAADVQLGIDNLRKAIPEAKWHWDRDAMQHRLDQLESVHA